MKKIIRSQNDVKDIEQTDCAAPVCAGRGSFRTFHPIIMASSRGKSINVMKNGN